MKFISCKKEIYSLKVNENDSVKTVIKELSKTIGKSRFDILLIFENRILLRNDSIGKYEINEEDFVLFDCNREYREFNKNTFPEEYEDRRSIKVNVKEELERYRGPRTYIIESRTNDTIYDLKDILSRELKENWINRREYELYKDGRLLDNDMTLAHYSINDEDVMTIRYVTTQVNVISLEGRTNVIEVRPKETIRELKEKLSKLCQWNISDIHLVYRGNNLMNDETIDDYHIEHCASMHMISPVRGGGFCIKLIPVNKNHKIFDVEGLHNKFSETINKASKENCVLSMQIDLFSDKNCSDKINNDNDYNNVINRTILEIYYQIKSKPSFPISFVPININFKPFNIDCSGDTKSILDRVSNQFNCPLHSFEYFTHRNKSFQVEDIDFFIRNCRQNSKIYFFIKFLVDNFVMIEELGEGAFGTVYKCREIESNKIVAVKQFKISGEKTEKIISFNNELKIIKSLKDHSRIIKFEGQRETKDAAYLLMEYAPKGSLGQYLKDNGALPENEISKYAKQILEGLQYLHNNNIVHGDIKGDNILLDNNYNIKLCDFGLSKSLLKMAASNSLHGSINSLGCTANWLAPEIISGEEYEFAADIWSFGATMIEMVTGRKPFCDYGNPCQVIFKIGYLKQVKFEYPSNGSGMMKEFIDHCLQPDPHRRAKINELLNHQF